ncbi:hypothetical protein CMU70_11450 [Elizabethkingia anophelis]|nr:hypothetical protein [Elizabethkingia anophelis]
MRKNLILEGIFIIYFLSSYSCREQDLFIKNNFSLMNSDKIMSVVNQELSNPTSIFIANDNVTKIPYILENIEGNNSFYLFSDDILIPSTSVNIVKVFHKPFNYSEIETLYNEYVKNYRPSRSVSKNNGPIQPSTIIWEGGVIILSISKDFPIERKSTLYNAISNWAYKTKLKFRIIEDENSNISKIRIIPIISGCRSSIGKPGNGLGEMSLSETCDLQSITHEIGHAVGLIHEHQRPIRNKYLTGLYTDKDYEFIQTGLEKLGKNGKGIVKTIKVNLSLIDVIDDSSPFDIKSVMMYGSYPRNDAVLLKFLQDNNKPFYKDSSGNEIPRPTFGLTSEDQLKVLKVYRGNGY